MGMVYRLLSLFLLLMALVVGVHYAITPLYDDGSTGFPVWTALNWPMAVAVVIAFAASACPWLRQHGAGAENGAGKSWLQTNMRFYASLVLILWFLNNWFTDLTNIAPSVEWAFVNALFVAVTLSSGLQLWRDSRQGAA